MKLIFFVIIQFAISIPLFSQPILDGVWTNDENECIIFNNLSQANTKDAMLQNAQLVKTYIIKYRIENKNQLVFYHFDNYGKAIDLYHFSIINANDSTLLLKPQSKSAKQFFKQKKIIQLKYQNRFINNSHFQFESIEIARGYCHGFCDVYSLKIDSNGKYSLFIEIGNFGFDENHNPKYISNQKFEGELTATEYANFKNKIYAINWKTFKLPPPNCRGCSDVTIKINHNNKSKAYYSTEVSLLIYSLLADCRILLEKQF